MLDILVRRCPQCRSFLPERTFVLPQGEPSVQKASTSRPGTLVYMHTSRGQPRSPARQAHLYPHFLSRNRPIAVVTLTNPARGIPRFNPVRVLQQSLGSPPYGAPQERKWRSHRTPNGVPQHAMLARKTRICDVEPRWGSWGFAGVLLGCAVVTATPGFGVRPRWG